MPETPSTEDVLTWAVIREYVGEGMREHPITDADARALRRCGDEPEAKIADAWLAARDREVAAKARADTLKEAADALDQQAATEGYRTLPSEGLHAAIQALKNAARTLRFSIGAGDE